MPDGKILLGDASIRITDLEVPSKDVADFFRSKDEALWEETLIQAIQVGVFCLERAQTGQDTEFVRRQVETLLTKVERAVLDIPSATEKALVGKIGSGEGQVLAPIDALVKEASRSLSGRLTEVRQLLSDEIDPAKETTTLGKALRKLKDLLDPERKDSIQSTLKSAVESVTSESGALARAVEAAAGRAVKPVADEVERLAKQIHGEEEAAAALEETTAKGEPYEVAVVTRLQRWAAFAGAEVHHVGPDNKPGDVVVDFGGDPAGCRLKIVVEARHRGNPVGRKAISDNLSSAMDERNANAGVYVSATSDGLAKEIGDWAEGQSSKGRFVACLNEHLVTAVRFLAAWERLSSLKAGAAKVDAASIEAQLQRVRTSLSRVTTISGKVTQVKSSADSIQSEAEAIRNEIREALAEIEEALRSVARAAEDVSAK